jgi:hypothetical protein
MTSAEREIRHFLAGETDMDSYIIRIYRREEQGHSPVSGLVEKVGAVGQEAFGTKEELWHILSVMKVPSRHREKSRSQSSSGNKKQENTD